VEVIRKGRDQSADVLPVEGEYVGLEVDQLRQLSYSSIEILLEGCLAGHVLEFLGWTPENVKLLLPPRWISVSPSTGDDE